MGSRTQVGLRVTRNLVAVDYARSTHTGLAITTNMYAVVACDLVELMGLDYLFWALALIISITRFLVLQVIWFRSKPPLQLLNLICNFLLITSILTIA
jgi:hypothetical protein